MNLVSSLNRHKIVAELPATLVYFSVFDPSLAPNEESAGDQICYFYPPGTAKNEKIRQVGLAQALINFTKYICMLVF